MAGSPDKCPACGATLSGNAQECPDCGLGLAGSAGSETAAADDVGLEEDDTAPPAAESQTVPGSDPLDAEHRRFERKLGQAVHAVGLFRRVDSGGVRVFLLGGVLGIGIAVALFIVVMMPLAAMGLGGAAGVGFLLLVVCSFVAGRVWAAHILRKAPEIPGDFGVVVCDDVVHFYPWNWDEASRTALFGPLAASCPRGSLSVAAGDIEMRAAGVPAVTAPSYASAALGFLFDGKPVLVAQVLSVEPAGDGKGSSVIYGTKNNPAYELLRREHHIPPPER